MKKIGTTITEFLAASVLFSYATFSTIENAPSYENIGDTIHQSVNAKNEDQRTHIIKNISEALRNALEICPNDYEVVIPTQSSFTHVFNGLNSVAILMPNSKKESYKGIVYSIIPEYEWYGTGSDNANFLLIQTIIDNANLKPVKNENIIDWSKGKSFIIAKDLKPALFNTLEYTAFVINPKHNKVDFSLISKQDGLYFPSYYGEKKVNDTKHISSIILEDKSSTIAPII